MRIGVRRCRSRRGHGPVRVTGLAICVVLLIAGCAASSSPVSTASAQAGATTTAVQSALRTIDPAALQATVDATAKEFLIPGAVVELRTPQGDFTAVSGTTLRGAELPPGTDTYFRIASNTKTMTAAVIVLLAQERKLPVRRSGAEVRSERAQRREHHHRGAADDAQRPVQLHERA